MYGALAGKSQFFGAATAETMSLITPLNTLSGGWDNDTAAAVQSVRPYPLRGGASEQSPTSGDFSFTSSSVAGGVRFDTSHRAILSGY
jgi:hypothetical protein